MSGWSLYIYCTGLYMYTVLVSICILYWSLYIYCTGFYIYTVLVSIYILYWSLYVFCTGSLGRWFRISSRLIYTHLLHSVAHCQGHIVPNIFVSDPVFLFP